ncbi:hypothetical protein RHMOL_Rhmol09G0128900 [Rhododendron molle]|uniref:Uncharacterized protein n=2 Tax=Rhododendron molle TaxID=49168 RepID=A0ACC0MCI0_RHOML|nr:hypothetical protein RHMOL_Rhmol09G0128900 [Rhododendron molle]KAI8538759.1 hypothetical protein RHMOL_Rhmol09G0128900 [Rhododendron molle]
MADAAVEFLLLNLKQLLVYNADLISGVKEQVESLYNELSMLKAFLKDSTEKRSEYEIVKELVRQIRGVVYEAEDVIDTFVVHTSLQKARSGFSKVIHGIDYPGKLRIVAKEIGSIRKRVDDLYRKQSFGFGVIQQQAGEKSGRGSPDKKAPVVEEENVVGFDQEAEILVARLNGGKEEMEVVPVIGMGGLGKTTLARKVFTGPVIEYEFYIRAWIYVSQEYSRKEVFLGILNSINKLTDEMYKWSDEKLAEELRVHLHCGRYLIVIDDVWTKGAWDDLKMAFPKNNNKIEQGESRREHTSFIHEAFKLLRVLEMRSINLPVFPVKMKELVHLRYIALHGDFEILPASTSYLWNLQTVIIETTSRTLKVEADFWKMLQLRHFFTNASSRLRGPPTTAWKSGKDPLVRRNLQTLSTISPESCTEDILARTPNLKKLGVRGKLRTLMEEKGGSSLFDNLTKLDRLVTLKLLNDTFPDRPSSGSLPPLYKFPPNLKKLTLADTLLDWEHMAILGILPKLEVLKLKDNAFKGERWEPLDGGFRLLRFLQIGRTDLVHWEGSSHHFPRLHRLILKHCESLKAVPSGLGDVSALQIIEVYHSSRNAVASVKQIQTQKQQGVAINQLKLLIYPPE